MRSMISTTDRGKLLVTVPVCVCVCMGCLCGCVYMDSDVAGSKVYGRVNIIKTKFLYF